MVPDQAALNKGLALARKLFQKIGADSFDGTGFTRAAYGQGEQKAHDTVMQAARELGLRVSVDAALNLAVTLEGSAAHSPPLLIGSHLDSVPSGGNFDGLAGVLAGLATVAAFREAGVRPRMDITVLGIRGEESAWYGAQHVGSRSMFGTLSDDVLDGARRVDTGRTLRSHMIDAGADISRIGPGKLLIDPGAVGAYLELHIEQGEKLLDARKPLGIVTGIRGNRRCRRIACHGEYGHSGTVARADRHDAVFATSELISRMDEIWRTIEEEEGSDLVVTFGRFVTDAKTHSVTTVPGLVETCFDARSTSAHILARVSQALENEMRAIAARRGVRFEHDPMTGDLPALMDASCREALTQGCGALGIPAMPIVSGAGHDAGDFAMAGVSSAMIFVRSENGSHNPREHMEFADFAQGVRLITWFASEMSQQRI